MPQTVVIGEYDYTLPTVGEFIDTLLIEGEFDDTFSEVIYFVAADGDDDHDGLSEAEPWLHHPWNAAATGVAGAKDLLAGDGVYLNRGDTFPGSLDVDNGGTAAALITTGAYGTGADPIVAGTGVDLNGHNYLRFENLDFQGAVGRLAAIANISANHIEVSGCTFRDAGILGLNSQGYCIRTEDPKTQIDAVIADAIEAGVTEIHAHFIDPYPASGHDLVTGASTLCYVTTQTASGMTPFAYLLQQAHANGMLVFMRVYVLHDYYWIGATSPLIAPLSDDANHHNTTNGGDTIQFANAEVRAKVAAVIADFVAQNPTVDGVSLDNCRADNVVTQTAADVAGLVQAIRAAIPGYYLEAVSETGTDMELDSPSSGDYSHYGQDCLSWITNGYIDSITYIGYFINWVLRNRVLVNAAAFYPACGLSMETSTMTLSTWKHCLLRADYWDVTNLLYFQYTDQFDDDDFRQAVIDMRAGTLTAAQLDVTKIVVTPGTSFSLTIDGDVCACTEASVSTHTTEGPLKQHYEDLFGDQPALILKRPTTSTIQVHLGDWKYG